MQETENVLYICINHYSLKNLSMDDLIKALQIFLKYNDAKYPTSCEHGILYVKVSPDNVNNEDKAELEKLGFFRNEDMDGFSSTKYGSN